MFSPIPNLDHRLREVLMAVRIRDNMALVGKSQFLGQALIRIFPRANDPPTRRSTARITWDMRVNYTVFAGPVSWPSTSKLTRREGRNVLDEDPLFGSGWGGNTNGYPRFLSSAEGRFYSTYDYQKARVPRSELAPILSARRRSRRQ